MTRLHLDRLRTHALGHEALKIGIDGPVFRGHGIPTRLRTPRRVCRLAGKQRLLKRLLNGVKDARLVGRQVAGEIAQECCFTESSPSSPSDNASRGGWRRKLLGQRRVILARIGRPRGDVDKGRDFRIDAGFGDDHA